MQKISFNKEGIHKIAVKLLPFVLVMAASALLITTFLVGTVAVIGDSMNPSYEDGDIILASRIDKEYRCGDVVIIDEGKFLGVEKYYIIKRVIGVAGDTLTFDADTSTLYVNGEKLDEPYLLESEYTMDGEVPFPDKYVVPENSIFVMGDNRNNSVDSRYCGAFPIDCVYGRVLS